MIIGDWRLDQSKIPIRETNYGNFLFNIPQSSSTILSASELDNISP